jgi:hypothetical protein
MDINYLITLFNGDNPLTFVIGVFVGVITKRYGTMAYDFVLKRVNFPNFLYPLFGKRFYGLFIVQITKKNFDDVQIKSMLYEIFCIFKKLNLTVENTSKILYRTAFKDKGDVDTVELFDEIIKRVKQSVKKPFTYHFDTLNHKRFEFMIKEFEELSQPYLSPQEAYLLMMMSGSCFGAVYLQNIYPDCIKIVIKMTISTVEIAGLEIEDKYFFLLLFSSFFIQDSDKANDLVLDGLNYYQENKDKEDFDIFNFVTNAINNQLPERTKP